MKIRPCLRAGFFMSLVQVNILVNIWSTNYNKYPPFPFIFIVFTIGTEKAENPVLI
jgi:uncharacterized membrane protein